MVLRFGEFLLLHKIFPEVFGSIEELITGLSLKKATLAFIAICEHLRNALAPQSPPLPLPPEPRPSADKPDSKPNRNIRLAPPGSELSKHRGLNIWQ